MLLTLGLPGVIVVSLQLVPLKLRGKQLQSPTWVLQLLSAIQSTVLLAIAVLAGATLATRVGLSAPALSALASGRLHDPAVARLALSGVLGGLVAFGLLGALSRFMSEPLLGLHTQVPIPPAVRLLYGAVTEEIILRFGFMTFLAWAFWELQGGTGTPAPVVMWLAVVLSALVFGLAHIPTALTLRGGLSPKLASYIVSANGVVGIITGWLFWRFGLEAAIVAHLTIHGAGMLAAALRASSRT